MTIRTRSRTTPSTSTGAKESAPTGGGWATSSRSKSEQAKKQAQQNRNFMPFRYWLKPGEEGEIVILDERPVFSVWEHQMKGSDGKWNVFELCPRDMEPCPLCKDHGESAYVMFLTIMDLRPYVDKNGNTHEFSRKLLCVKVQQHSMFYDMLDRQEAKNGTLRGVHLLMKRDTGKTARIGQPQPGFFEVHSEEELIESFGHEEKKNKEGEVYKKANEDAFAFDYLKLFSKPSAKDICERYGYPHVAGSSAEQEEVWGDDEGDTETGQTAEEAPAKEAKTEKKSGGIRRRSSATTQAAESSEEELDDVPL